MAAGDVAAIITIRIAQKGKGKGKLGWFEASETYSEWDYGGSDEGSLKYLSSLTRKSEPVQTSNYWSEFQEEEDEESADGWQSNDVASGDARLATNSSKGAPGGSSHTGGVSDTAGDGSNSFGSRRVRIPRDVDAALSGDQHSRGKRTGGQSATETRTSVPPLAALDGTGINISSKTKGKTRRQEEATFCREESMPG